MDYGFQPFPATADDRHKGRWRVSSVEGEIVRRRVVERPNTPDPPIGSLATYLSGQPKLAALGMDKGHIFGLNIGGENISNNIVPMFSYFNQVEYKRIEDGIYADGRIHALRISVSYRTDADLAIPDGFDFFVKMARTKEESRSASFAPYKSIKMMMRTDMTYPIDNDVRLAISRHIPDVRPESEPYAFLEGIQGLGEVKEATEFSATQRQYILTANAMYTHGVTGNYFLMSDDADDIHQSLNMFGGRDRPQVDHLVPKSANGSNSFRNALVVSSDANSSKRARVSEEDMQILMAARDPRPSRRARASGPKHRRGPYDRPPGMKNAGARPKGDEDV